MEERERQKQAETGRDRENVEKIFLMHESAKHIGLTNCRYDVFIAI